MRKIRTIRIDLTDCQSEEDIHVRFGSAFRFPSWYGKNLDALWDLLSEVRNDFLIVTGFEAMPKRLRRYFERVIQILDRTIKWQEDMEAFFDYRMIDGINTAMPDLQMSCMHLTGCDTPEKVQEWLKRSLSLPESYDGTLESLWEQLQRPRVDFIKIKGTYHLPDEMYPYLAEVLRLFQKAKELHTQGESYFNYRAAVPIRFFLNASFE